MPHHVELSFQKMDIDAPNSNLYLLLLYLLALSVLRELLSHLLTSLAPKFYRRYEASLTSKLILTVVFREPEYKSGEFAYNKGWRKMLLFYEFSKQQLHLIPLHWLIGKIHFHIHRKQL